MNIQGVGTGGLQYSGVQSSQLDDEQKDQLAEILSNYDPEKITKSEMKDMLTEIRDAGIQPGRDMINIMKENGFGIANAKSSQVSEDIKQKPSLLDYLSSNKKTPEVSETDKLGALYEQFENGEISKNELVAQVRQAKGFNAFGAGTTGNLINVIA